MSKEFQKAAENIYLLESPLGSLWSGIVLIDGQEKILIDSGDNAEVIDESLIPALEKLGYSLNDISWLCHTHCHGDHVGGTHRLVELSGIKVAAYEAAVPKLKNPLKYSKQIRAVYPEHSPNPPAVLLGTDPDLILKDGEMLAERLQVIATPGHDTECVCFYEPKTKTLITGDSLQGNGTITQGIALYMDLEQYRCSLKQLMELDIETIISGHPYLYCGSAAYGKEEAKKYLNRCAEIVDIYDAFVKEQIKNGVTDSVLIAEGLIEHMGNTRPNFLFLPLYTVDAHRKALKTMDKGEK